MNEENVLTERQQFWLDHIQAARVAGDGLAHYAREHNLKPKDLYQWSAILVRRGLLEQQNRNSKLQPVQIAGASGCSVHFQNGTRLELAEMPSGPALRELIDCLQRVES